MVAILLFQALGDEGLGLIYIFEMPARDVKGIVEHCHDISACVVIFFSQLKPAHSGQKKAQQNPSQIPPHLIPHRPQQRSPILKVNIEALDSLLIC
jgi:hypothetical protein